MIKLYCFLSLLFINLSLLCHLEDYIDLNVFSVPFFDSMQIWKTYKKNLATTDIDTLQIKELYENFVINNLECSPTPKIPLIIHQIWLGSPFPYKFKVYQQSWLNMHPHWQYFLWTDKEIENFGLINKNLYDKAENWGMKSDIARIEILDRFGGLYIDVDFECLRSFDILHHCFDFYSGCNGDYSLCIFNGLIASCPNHPILKKYIKQLSEYKKDVPKRTEYVKIMETTGPYFFTQCVLDTLHESVGRCVIFPLSYFYPYSNSFEHTTSWHQEKIKESSIRPESFAIHWFGKSWQEKELLCIKKPKPFVRTNSSDLHI